MGFKPDSAPAPATGRFVADKPTAPPDSGNRSMLQRGIGYVSGIAHALRGDDVKPDAMSVGPGTIPAAVGENLLTMGTSIAAPVIAGVKWAKNAITGEPTDVPAELGAHTYEPKTGGGQYLEHLMAAGMAPLMDALKLSGKGYGEIAGLAGADPQTKENVAAIVPASMMAVAGAEGAVRAVPNVRAEIARTAARPSPPGPGGGGIPPNLAALRAAGYPVMPSQAAAIVQRAGPRLSMPSVEGDILETLTNRGETQGRFSIEVAKNTETILRNEFGIPPDVPLTTQTFADLISRANAAYDVIPQALPVVDYAPMRQALDQLGEMRRANPNLDSTPGVEALRERLVSIQNAPTQQVLDAIREFRSDARRYFQSQSDPVVNEQIARAYRQAADTLEGGIAEQLRARGEGALYDQFQAARQFQAKLHNVLDSWNGYEIDPQALARIGQDTTLTGGLADIQRAGQHIPETAKVTTGMSVGRPTNAGTIMEPKSSVRRALFDQWVIPKLLSDAFQGKYGTIAGRSPALPYATVGPLGNPDVGPRQPPPPPGGRFPRDLAGEGPPELVPEGGGVPFSSTPIPPQTGAADALGGIFDTNLFRGADTSAADAFPYDLARAVDESPPPPAMPGYGHPELPVDPYAINPDQLRPNVPVGGALQPGASPTGMAVIPEGPMEILPPPPDMSPFELAPEPRPRGPDTIDFTPDQPAPPDLAAGFDLAGQGSGLDFMPSDIQLGGRGRVLNPDRRNLPRAGGRKTDAGDLRLETPPAGPDEFPMLPAPPPPAPLVARGPYVGRPQDFTDLGMTPGTARASSPRGEVLGPDEGPAATGMKDVTPPRGAEEIGEPAGLTEGLEGEPPLKQVAPPNSLSASDEAMFDDALRALDRIETERNATAAQTAREKGEAGPRAVGEERGEPAGLAEAVEGEKPELTLEDAPERAAPVTPDYEVPVNLADHPPPENLPKGRATTITLYRGVSDANRAGNAKGAVNYTPDSRVAARYGDVTERQVAFKNRLDAPTLSKLHESVGLPEKATRDQLYERLKELGYDGARYTLPDGEVEYIHFPSAE
ncbi:MAG TPA: hypothetical protein PLE54_11570 [Burkholderiaceae bacterium]|nr:hypothetical protein [Burkholderiaceae bacterium]